MKIERNDIMKTLYIWLTNEENSDTAFKESLKPLFTEYSMKKYFIVVLESGKGNLYENLTALLLNNRNVA